ncbi:GNAT family N-acetyltransferase [Corynebacterium sp. A21]|uniref:GNAT family N-acetyltransferase n=1 Tax=Corynebacterium sp. A21 TaxID=3457318 RepID=UPI003FD1B0DD
MATVTRTDRLILMPLSAGHEDEAFKVYSDDRVWGHRPQARHETVRETQKIIQRTQHSWQAKNLGPWGVYLRDQPSDFVGVGGLELVEDKVWDLKYRLRPEKWGSGYASEISEAALKAVKRLDPDTPITARVTVNHPASFHVLEKLGLRAVWEGRRVGTEDDPTEPDVRIYADRELSPEILELLINRP